MAFIGIQPPKAAITSSDITDGVVTADKLASNAVTTAKINADAVTDAKIADDVVGTEHLTAGEVDTTALGADAVTAAKIADDAISEEHLDATVITGMTELAAEPADTDEFLISDAGTLKRIDYSHIKGGGITVASQWRINNSPSGLNNNDVVGESGHGNWEQNDTQYSNIGSAMSVSNGVFTFPSTGIYLVSFKVSLYDATEQSYFGCNIRYTTDNSNFNDLAEAYTSLKLINDSTTYASTFAHSFLDVTDTSNVKVRFVVRAENNGFDINGSSSVNKTVATFIRLGDT